ncbi:hypothetical protein [Gymnodinialimonas ulvae]|uniref:hypothetical protein n=1 Tax=Gymnodinialimonas ulvae TaxID=3126504 RepID=UPI0030B2AE87
MANSTTSHPSRTPYTYPAPETPTTPFPQTWPFWAALFVAATGIVLAWLAQPAVLDAILPLWMVPVGYFTAGLGVTALFLAWMRYRAR